MLQIRKRSNKKFSPEEDNKLRKLVTQYGENSWEEVASRMKGRNVRQCHDRWTYYLSPKVSQEPWTSEEDKKLIELTEEIGGKWVQISKHFKGRNDTQIKNRWNILKKKLHLPDVHKKKETLPEVENKNKASPEKNAEESEQIGMINSMLDKIVNVFQNEQAKDPYDVNNNVFW